MSKRSFVIMFLENIIIILLILIYHNHKKNSIISSFSKFIKTFNLNLNPVEQNKKLLAIGKKILYVSRHEGTIANFDYIAKHLGFNITVLKPDYGYRGKPKCYVEDKCRSFVKEKCSEFDFIIISDIIPDSYIYVTNKCNKKIILEITNRFDYSVKDKTYYKVMAQAVKKKNVIVAENNPFEVYHACEKNIFIANYYLIRPVGNPPNNIIKKEHGEYHDIVGTIFNRNLQTSRLLEEKLNKIKLTHKILPVIYGGPLVLATYKAIIMLPYQVSVMKMMENIRYGVPMIIPSEKLIRELIKAKYKFAAKQLFNIPNGVRKYIEFYNDEFRDLFIYFDSFNDLPNILKNTDFKAIREKEKKFMKSYEPKVLKMWSEVLDISNIKESKISDKEPLCNNKVFF